MRSSFANATVVIPLAALAMACAGEFREPAPPGTEVAVAPSSAQPIPALAAASATPAPSPSATPAVSAVASGATSAPGPSASAAPPDAPAPAAKGNITGSVTARPAALGGKNIIVYLVDGPSAPGAGTKAEIDQRGMTFLPLVTPIAAGGSVVFLNNDPFPHNVFSPDGTKFNLGTLSRGQSVSRPFETPGAYTLLCNLHPNMIAYILVTPSTYFARADKDGRYSLQGVPTGTYKVSAWGPRLAPQTQSVTVGAGDSAADFQLQR